jgi:hypothetical protein
VKVFDCYSKSFDCIAELCVPFLVRIEFVDDSAMMTMRLDIAEDGHLLVTMDFVWVMLVASMAGQWTRRYLSPLDWSREIVA